MGDPKTIRLNNADKPNRLDTFERSVKRAGQNASDVFREMADAYARYVEQHGHGPAFPFQIVPFEPPKVVRKRPKKK